jgi:uncharacterized membrane protein
MPTSPLSIAFFVVAALLGAVGQFLYKSGAEAASGGIMSYVYNYRLLGGVACYIAVMALFVAAFKRGGALSVLYPVYASTFIFAALIAWWAFGEPIKPVNIVGTFTLVLGRIGGSSQDSRLRRTRHHPPASPLLLAGRSRATVLTHPFSISPAGAHRTGCHRLPRSSGAW